MIPFSAQSQNGVTRVYTDYNGYWTSAEGAINPIKPDNKHNLVGFTWNGNTYSTGVNDALLNSKGIQFSAGLYQAFPVANITLDGLNANYVALGYKEDGDEVQGKYPYSTPVKISYILTRGANGLDLGSAITNIPASNDPLTFNFGAIKDPTLIGDNVPDILISQVASPGSNNLDLVWFEDINHQRVGNEVTINMSNSSVVPAVGNWTLDLYSPVTGNIIQPAKTERQIRIWAADASLFGLNQSNYTQPLYLRYKLGGASDPAFLAFNRKFIEIINANDDVDFTELNTPVNINVLDNDGPQVVLDPNSLMVSVQPAHGTATVATVNGERVITYTPAQGFEGTDRFIYSVCNNAATPTCDDAQVVLTVGSADVSVKKTTSTTTPYIGGNIVFDLVVKNEGTGTAQGVLLIDNLPAAYTFVSSNNVAFSNGNWNIGTLLAGEERRVSITAKINATGPYTNTATVSSTSIDRVEANNTSSVTPVPTLMADLSVTKSVDNPTPIVGSNVIFKIEARNLGPSNATGVTVNDMLPSGYTFISATSATNYNPATGVWTIGAMPSSSTAVQTLTITATVNATGNFNNTAVIQGSQADAIPANNRASALTSPVPKTDLSITKTVSLNTPEVNTNTEFTLTVTNNGPSDASGVIVNDPLPTGYTYLSASSPGSYDNTTGKWTIGNLANGATTTLTLSVKVNPTGNYLNTATVSASTTDPLPDNNVASIGTTPVPITDLMVIKLAEKDIIHNGGTVRPGDTEVFTITVTNNGPSAATGVYATDKLPTGYLYSSYTAPTGTTYNSGTGRWSIGNLASGATVVLTIRAIILSAGVYVNSVSVTGTQKDPDLTNNQDTYPLGTSSANLKITKAVSNKFPKVGDNIIFTIVVKNDAASSSDAPEVVVNDLLPSGYTYISSSISGTGQYRENTGVWFIGTLIKNRSQTLTVTAKVNPDGDYLNVATVSSAIPDPATADNRATEFVSPVANADLGITKIIDNSALNSNQGNFTLQVINNGPSVARNIVVTDILPSGYTYLSASPTIGTYNPANGEWTFPNLAVGASASLILNSTVNPSGTYTNTGNVKNDYLDPVSGNDIATATPAPLAPTGESQQSFCEIDRPSIANLVVQGRAIKWYTAETGGTALLTTTALRTGVTYYASQTLAGIESINRFAVTVTINIVAVPGTPSATQNFCEGSGVVVNDIVVTGNLIKWYDQLTGGNLLPGNTLLINNKTYYATQTVDGCESRTRRAVTVRINTVAAPTGMNVQSFCEISASRISNLRTEATGVVKWYDSETSDIVLDAGRQLVNGRTYYATQTLNSCESVTRFAVKVVITSIPSPTALNEQTFCAADQPTLTNIQTTGLNILWYSAITGGDPLLANTPLVDGNTYFASQTIEGCESVGRAPVKITLSPMPAAPTLAVNDPVAYCPGDQASPLQAIATAGNTFLWYETATGGTASLTAPTPQTAIPGTTVYYVSQRNIFGCEGPRTAISVLIHEIPPIPVSNGDQIACQTATPLTLTASAIAVTGYSIVWYDEAGSVVQSPVLSSVGTITYYAAAKNDVTGCLSLSKTPVSLTINPLPAKPVSGGDQAECPTTPSQTLTATATAEAGSSVLWYDAATAGNLISPVLNATGTATYYAAAKNNTTGCESLERTAVSLTLYAPIEATVAVIQPICTARTGTVTINSATGTSYRLTGINPEVPATSNTTGIFNTVEPGTYSLQVSNANGCILTLTDIQVNQPSCPEISLTKVANNQVNQAGDVINYTLLVKNTGNVTLTNVSVTDEGADAGSISPLNISLLPGATATISARHTLSQAEVNAGRYSNQASVSSTDPDQNTIVDPASDNPNTPEENDPTVVTINRTPAITLVKTGILSADFESVTYAFNIQNTGNVSLSNINLKDDKLGLNQVIAGSLEPGAVSTITQSYTLTVADKNFGSTTNTAAVTALSPTNSTVTDVSGTQQDNDRPTVVQIPSESSIALVKTAALNGNMVTYTFTLTNTGKLSLQNIKFSDPKLGISNRVVEGILYPGSTISFTETYTLTQADRNLASVSNTATVTAETPGEVIVRDQSGTGISNDEPTTLTVPHAPIAVNDRAETKANAPVLINILDNDDPINSSFDRSTVVIVDQPRNGSVRVNSDGTVTYTPLPGFTGDDSFTYHVTDIEGYQTNNALVSINANFFNLIIPNTITPNGDGINDTFKIPGLNQYADNELVILSRWGNEVFRIKNYQDSWDAYGLAEGTYFYSLKVKRKDTQKFETLRGWILVKRSFVN